jgi:aspartate racemase
METTADQVVVKPRKPIGVLGGLGPLTSAEFMKTIYQSSLGEYEQHSPNVILLSDPAFPDRTSAILAGNEDVLIEPLTNSLQCLVDLGSDRIVICCMTIHAVLHKVPQNLRNRVVSLLDVIFDHVADSGGSHLIVCTKGTRQMKLFESHPRWEHTRDHFIMPGQSDQDMIHEMIYRMKSNSDREREVPILHKLGEEYSVNSFVSGCTEVHLLVKHLAYPGTAPRHFGFVDPLMIIARQIAEARL